MNKAKLTALCALRASPEVTGAEINDAINEVEKLSTKAEGE